MYGLNRPARLTRRARVRLSWAFRRPVLEIEEEQDCLASLRSPPTGTNIVKGYRWRRATANDLLVLGSDLRFDA